MKGGVDAGDLFDRQVPEPSGILDEFVSEHADGRVRLVCFLTWMCEVIGMAFGRKQRAAEGTDDIGPEEAAAVLERIANGFADKGVPYAAELEAFFRQNASFREGESADECALAAMKIAMMVVAWARDTGEHDAALMVLARQVGLVTEWALVQEV